MVIVCFRVLEFDLLEVISGQVLVCDSAHSCPLEDQASCTMIRFLTQSQYSDIELNSLFCTIVVVVMPSVNVGSDKYQFCNSFGLTRMGTEPSTFHMESLHSTI